MTHGLIYERSVRMIQWMQSYLSPKAAYRLAAICSPWFLLLAFVLLTWGLYGALYAAPIDYQQGAVYRIIYIHVPCAILSLGLYSVMTVSSFVFLIWKVKVMDALSYVCSCTGLVFTVLTLITGSIWGKPTWGAWWVWDARLTSELILLFIYIGILALRQALVHTQMGDKAVSVLVLIGAINIPIIHYSVDWWQTLHQGATILRLGSPNIAPSMLHPLLLCVAGMIFFSAHLMSLQLRAVLLQRGQNNRWAKYLQAESFHGSDGVKEEGVSCHGG